MLRLPEFNYYQPRSLKQATKALADLGTDVMLVAGGTDVYPKMKRGQFTPRNLISLRALRELKGIRQSKEGLWIGAGESLTTVSNHRADRKTFSRARSRRGIGFDAAAPKHGNHRRQCSRRHPLQLLRSNFFLAPGGGLLHEKRRRHLSGRSRQREVPGDRVVGHRAGVGELGRGSNFGKSTGRAPREARRFVSRRRHRLFDQSQR